MTNSNLDPDGPLPQDMDDHDEPDLMPCPHCRKFVTEDAWECPHCHKDLSDTTSNTSLVLILLVCLLILLTGGFMIFWR